MTRVFKPQDFAEQTAFAERLCRRCPRAIGCTILADARPLDETDPDYPADLVYDDDGKPFCTSFVFDHIDRMGQDIGFAGQDMDSLPPVTARPVPPVPAARLDIASIETTTVVRGLVDALKLRPGRRSFTVPYADVSELFRDDSASALREALDVPEPTKARVHHGRLGVTITARSRRDASSVTSSVRLKLAGRRG